MWIASALATIVVAVVGLCVCAGLLFRTLLPSGPPYDPGNKSWQYGEDVMQNHLYGTLHTLDTIAVCTDAMESPVNPPTPFDRRAAIAGCRYGEWEYDN
ncbi:hypothetical protein SAMN05444157_0052 [Frankineae bacterium MT45]|nr:hypothetical protein SAMN05444157_0052 [Frankineae bacterium MT45]